MRNEKFTINEYEVEERLALEKIYAETLPESKQNFKGKDLDNNTSVSVRISGINPEGDVAFGETDFGQSVIIDIKREEKVLNRLGYPSINLEEGQLVDVVVSKNYRGYVGSVVAGYEKALKAELSDAIKNDNYAFKAKVISVCNGGFMVDISGIQCFLPGSLAAANRILDFSQYVGREITVMPEIYDQKREIFVVSFKKYLRKIIDKAVQDLSFTEKYQGIVTGTTANVIFVEWNEIFTGNIQISPEDENKEKLSEIKAGDSISFYVTDVKNPMRISLSLYEPSDKLKNIQELKDASYIACDENVDLKIYKGEIIKIKTFGALVKLENGLIGLIEKENLIGPIKEYEVGELVKCSILSVDQSTLKIRLTEEE